MKKNKYLKSYLIFTIIFICVLFATIFFMTPRELENKFNKFCYDYCDLLDDYQEAEISNTCREIQDTYKVNVVIVTCKRSSYGTATLDGFSFLSKENMSCNDNVVVIILNAQSKNVDYHFDIYTCGASASRVKNKEINKILYSDGGDIILNNYPQVCQGLKMVASLCGKAYYGVLPNKSWILIFIISLAISFIISLIIVLSIKKSYTRNRNNENFSFETNSNLKLTQKEDKYVNSVTTSVVIASTSSSGGGGHHSSGGGGGGGHRGGR